MGRTMRRIMRTLGITAGATVGLRATSCDVQNPPENTQCFYGVCVALGKLAEVDNAALRGFEPAFADATGSE